MALGKGPVARLRKHANAVGRSPRPAASGTRWGDDHRSRRAIAETSIAECDQQIRVSVGGATYGDAIDSPDALVDAAEEALYLARRSGRNRMVVA
jgi:GGDEF domain-containing protein